MGYRSAGISHPGRVREQNEDAWLADDGAGIWLVADGMGGHAGGEVASELAVEQVYRRLRAGDSLAAAIQEAHGSILEHARREPALTGMGTTLVAARARGRRLELAWVGDSRIYLTQAGEVQLLTRDHSFIQDMVLRGVLTEEEAQQHPRRNMVRQALGHAGGIRADTTVVKLKARQRLLLCSDGVHDMLQRQQIARAMEAGDLEPALQQLQSTVLATEASDNFTALAVERRRWFVSKVRRAG